MHLRQWFIALLSLALVLGVVYWEWSQRTSPGALHPSHASVVELQGSNGCAACHGKSASEMSAACSTCHKDIKLQMDNPTGLHGLVRRSNNLACAACHVEHVNGKVALVAASSFRIAGFKAPDTFDHAKVVKFDLNGKHAEIGCIKCHPNADLPNLAKDSKRFLGLSQACATCHKDVHEGTFGFDCASCHGQSLAFKPAATFKHTDEFPLVGGHDGHACKDCHNPTGPNSVGALKLKPLKSRACQECHISPHKHELITRVAQSIRKAEGESCVACHRSDDRSFLSPTATMSSNLHAMTGFALNPPHDKTKCVECHQGIGTRAPVAATTQLSTKFASLYPGRLQSACGECHLSPHLPALTASLAKETGKSENNTCGTCHGTADLSFLSPTAKFPIELHRLTGFALDIPHDKTKCVECHNQIGERPRLTAGPKLKEQFATLYPSREQKSCEQCHTDPHKGQFASIAGGNHCISCHAAERFVPSNFDLAKHDSAKMPLTEAHRAVSCVQCHQKKDAVVRYIPVSTACVDCHVDAHRRVFDSPDKPRQVNGKLDCARCHSTRNFSDVTWTPKDHLAWAGYALNGAHATASCTACHTPTKTDDTLKRTFGFAATACSACHVDPHAGQFAIANNTDCAKCHSDTQKFSETTFDHQRDSTFKLDANHVNLSCAACHRSVATSPGVQIVRYRPLGTRCEDCHVPGGIKQKGSP